MEIVLLWIAVAALARLIEGTWWSPGSVLALALSVVATGTTIFAPEYYLSLNANLYLQVLVIVTSIGAMIGQRLGASSLVPVSRRKFVINKKTSFFLFGFTASLSSAVFTMQTTGVTIKDLASAQSVMRAAQRVTHVRYSEGLDFPIAYNVSNALLLSYAIAISAHFVAINRVELKLLIPLVLYGSSVMLITERAPIIFMILPMLFAAIYTSKLVSENGRFVSLRNRKVMGIILGIAVLLGTIFFSFQVLRFGEQSTRSAGEVWAHLRRYPWGSLPGFSLWFDGSGATDVDTVPGYYTFMGIYDNLGIADRTQRVYADYISLARGEPANVYTVFRGLFHDFGPLGSGIFMFIIGLVGGKVARGSLSGSYISLAIYVGVMTFVAFAFVVSTWAYASNLAALVILPVVLKYFTAPSRQDAYAEIGGKSLGVVGIR